MSTIGAFTKPRLRTAVTFNIKEKSCCWCSSSSSVARDKEKHSEKPVTLNFTLAEKLSPVVENNINPIPPHRLENEKSCEDISNVRNENRGRKNDLNIQMLSESLYSQVFGKNIKPNQPSQELIRKAKEGLKEHGLWKKNVDFTEDIFLKIPPLKGDNIEEHFRVVGEEQSKPYKNLVSSFIKKGLPDPPKEWLCQKGWTKYVVNEKPVSVPFPTDEILVFDVEVNVKLGELPTLATAVSPTAWYGWVCSDLAEDINSIPVNSYDTSKLIPFEGKNVNKEMPRLIVGHNISYDRARIKEQYHIKNSALRFLDTMSLHICIGGINRTQKTSLKKNSEESDADLVKVQSCFSSLKEVYVAYCGKYLEKEPKNVFLEGYIPDVKVNFQNLMQYCANDVRATYEVLQAIFPVFLNRFPHPVTLAGMLEMGSAFLPVNSNWNKFIKEAEQTYEDLKSELSSILSRQSDKACRLFHNEQYKQDLWMWSEDWSTQELRLTKKKLKPKSIETNDVKPKTSTGEEEEDQKEKELNKKFQYLFDLEPLLPKRTQFLPGYPLWYRKLCEKPGSENWTPSPVLSTAMIVTPKLLGLSWENFPLYHTHEYGWGILIADVLATNVETDIPFEKLKQLTLKNFNINQEELEKIIMRSAKRKQNEKNNFLAQYYKGSGIWCNHIIDNCCFFLKIPHKDGSSKNVGNPLAKDITHVFSSGVLGTSDHLAEKVLDLAKKLTYWRNNRHRIMNQMVVWINRKEASVVSNCDEDSIIGIIVPQVVVSGTLTRRAMEATWLTASKVTHNRIGSELRSMIQAPPGYHFVGADVDSQELWIASLIGDSYFAKMHGCTPLGWMTLSGTKSQGTDMHSVTAKAVGISRDHAKVINYARIYGAGVRFAEKLLKQFNPCMSEEEARSKASAMYSLTKGKKGYKIKKTAIDEFINNFGTVSDIYDLGTAARIAKFLGKKIEDVFEKSQWMNGTESAMFNQLEKIANSSKPKTPFLQSRLSRALEPRFEGDDLHLNTRINWVVQSGAVDFLHLMLVCMKWLTNGKARYCFSFHDEVRYLISTEERYNGALAMHITNLLVRAFCAFRLGIYDLPQSVAFFSSVEVDKTLRKEANDDCITPSNPHGIEKAYGIAPGESLNIYEAIRKSEGSLSPFGTGKKRVLRGEEFDPSVEVIAGDLILVKIDLDMSEATKRKHVHRELLQGDLLPPKENQQIVKVLGSRGSNLHEVETSDSTTFLVTMPNKFRKNVWIKRGDFVLIEPIKEGGKVKAEIVNILMPNYIKFLKKENIWPAKFSYETESAADGTDNLFVNNNRKISSSESESSEETE